METEVISQDDVVGILKAKYFAVKEAIADAEDRHAKAVSGLNEPKAKEDKAKHEIELLKARIESRKSALKTKKEELSRVREDLGEAKTEFEESEDLRKEFKDADTVRTEKLEDVEEKCSEAKEHLFEVNRKFSEATRSLAMREYDLEVVNNRLSNALGVIEEMSEMKVTSGQQVVCVEKRGGRAAERKLEKEKKIEQSQQKIENLDDGTEEALRTILKLELQREYKLDEITYWRGRAEKISDEVNNVNQEDWGDF